MITKTRIWDAIEEQFERARGSKIAWHDGRVSRAVWEREMQHAAKLIAMLYPCVCAEEGEGDHD